MTAIELIKNSFDLAKEIVKGAPEWASEYCMESNDYINYCDADNVGHCDSCISISELERLIESVELVESYGGIDSCRNSIYMLHELTEDPEPIREAIADWENIYGP